MWVPTADLPKNAGHPFYERLNRVLDDAGFDAFVEAQCASFYADGSAEPGAGPLFPAAVFSATLKEWTRNEQSRGRAADSLSIRAFLDYAVHEARRTTPTLSRTRRLIDLETHQRCSRG